MLTDRQIERFYAKTRIVQRHMSTPCVEWQGAISKQSRGEGYGNVKVNGRNYKAHIIGFVIQFGRLPAPGMVVMHQCDNRRCVYHLEEGTQSDNMFDMHRKGRGYVASGERNPGSKINAQLVKDIVFAYKQGVPPEAIADQLDSIISTDQIKRIINGKAWRHITINLTLPDDVDEITLNVGSDGESL